MNQKPTNLTPMDVRVRLGRADSTGETGGYSVIEQDAHREGPVDPQDLRWDNLYGEFRPFSYGQLRGGITEWDARKGLKHLFVSSAVPLELAILISVPGYKQVRQGRFIHLVDESGARAGELELIGVSSARLSQEQSQSSEWVAYHLGESLDIEVSIRFRDNEFVVNDRSFELLTQVDQFDAPAPVRYLKVEGTTDEVAFIFSAMSAVGDLTFNYKSSLAEFKGTQYFILDDSREQGTYYLCENRDFQIARSVQKFIQAKVSQLNVSEDRVYFFGSSKGGTAAVWHGLKLGFGNIVVAAPQFLVGDFLKKPHPGVLEYMAGGRSQEDIDWLNHVFPRTLDPATFQGKVRVLVGDNDPHKDSHVPELIKFLKSGGVDAITMPVLDANHGETGMIYASMLRSFSLQNDAENRFFYALSANDERVRLSTSPLAEGSAMAVRVYQDGKEFSMDWYQASNVWNWKNISSGELVFRVFERPAGEKDPAYIYNTRRVDLNSLKSRKY